MKKLLVIETDGANEVSAECSASGWHPVFVRTQNYKDWLPLEKLNPNLDIRTEGSLSHFDIIKIMMEEGAQAILPISLLEPEGVRDSLVRDYILSRQLPVNIVANSSSTMENTYDKWLTKEILTYYNIAVTPSRLIRSLDDLKDIEAAYGYPMIVKERKSYTGMGVRIVSGPDELTKYVTRNLHKGLFAEPFLSGSEVSMEVIGWKEALSFQPLVYKGETRLNLLEHPAYRPRIAPYKPNSALEKEITEMVRLAVHHLRLQGAAEFEFLVIDNKPFIMEINPRISGITRLCHAAGGRNAYRELAYICLHDTMRKAPDEGAGKFAVQFPLSVLPEGDLLTLLQEDPDVSYIKPISWMPVLPIKSNVIMSSSSVSGLFEKILALAPYTDVRYINEARRSFESF